MPLPSALPLIAVASAGAVLMLLLRHVVYILATLVVSSVVRKETESARALEAFARRGLIGRLIALVVMVVTSVFRLLIQGAHACLLGLYHLLPIIVISALLALFQVRWGAAMHVLDTVASNDMPFIRALLLAPFALASQAGLFLAPIANLVIYAFLHVPIDVLLWSLSGWQGVDFASGLLSILLACREAAVAFVAYLGANPSDCSRLLASARANCTGDICFGASAPPFASAALACLDPGLRSIRLSASNALAQEGITGLARAVGSADVTLGRGLSMVAYPFTDPNLWSGVESLANALLSCVVGLPTTTMGRCGLAYAQDPTSLRLSMCFPDVHPPFNALVAAFRSTGAVLNGWLNMLFVLLVHGSDAPCPSAMDVSATFSDPLWSRLAGGNETVLVRLSDTLFARTDGSSIVYVSTESQVSQTPLKRCSAHLMRLGSPLGPSLF